MGWLELETNFFDAARVATGLATNWLIQSTLLIAGGLAVGFLIRHRGSAVQSAVYRTTLVAVLLCPFAAWSLSRLGVSGWSLAMPSAYEVATKTAPPAAVAVPETAPPTEITANSTRPIEQASLPPVPPSASDIQQPAPLFNTSLARSDTGQPAVVNLPPPVAATAQLLETSFDVHRFGIVAGITGAVWLVAGGCLLVRLVAGSLQLHRLRRGARSAEPPTIESCREIAAKLSVTPPDVVHSPFLPSPCLAGLRRPAVMLPETELSLPVRDVLVHELAHLRRHDCLWNLLRHSATAILFFQPLLWKLSRRLAETAEEVCDDYVVQFGGDRREYAHRLVDIATLSVVPLAATGVGMVTFRSILAARVARILDTSRSLSTRVGSVLLALLLVAGLSATLLVGLLGVEPTRVAAEGNPEKTSNDDTTDAVETTKSDEKGSASTSREDDGKIVIHGQVVDPDGKPFAGAKVQIARWYWDRDLEQIALANATSGPDGRFTVAYRKSQFKVDLQRPDMWKEVSIVATAPGFGPDWIERDKLKPGEEPKLQLVRDDVPITGRVIDLEGNPVAGVRIRPETLLAFGKEGVDQFLEAVRRGKLIWQALNLQTNSKLLPGYAADFPKDIVTDAQGRFRITGVGRERRVRFRLEGPTIALTEVEAVTRPMEPILGKSGVADPKWSQKTIVYGADFHVAVLPTQPITGVVRDAKTGKPLPGVAVHSYRMSDRAVSADKEIRVTADAEGRYRLVGMPKGTGRRIIAIPNDEQPYLMREFDVPNNPGLQEIQLDLNVDRGVWIKGRITDKKTGKPLGQPNRVELYYLPYLNNKFANALPEFNGGNVDGYQDRYRVKADGTYRLVGLPGRAIVGVQCWHMSYPRGMGSESIQGMTDTGHFLTYRAPVDAGRKWPTAMKEVTIAENQTQFNLDFDLDSGHLLKITTTGPDNQEIAGVAIWGLLENDAFWQTTDRPSVTALAFGPQEKRTMLFHHKQRNLGQVVRAEANDNAPDSITVKLEPCATIRGRLVDENERPVADASIRFDVRPGGDFEPGLSSQPTDADGRFEHKSVLPGASYAVFVESPRLGFKVAAKEVKVAPGETIDLGTIDVTSDKRLEMMRTAAETTHAGVLGDIKTKAKLTTSDTTKLLADKQNTLPTPNNKNAANDNERTSSDTSVPIEYAGQVVMPDGKPSIGAKIFFIYWIPESAGSASRLLKPLAVTNATGNFRLSIKSGDLPGDKSEWGHANIAAVADGYGFAWTQAALFDTSGKSLAEYRRRVATVPPELRANVEKTLAEVGQPLRLVADKVPIQGRIVDINGQPISGVKLSLLEVSAGENDELTPWLEATQADRADYYSARMKTPRMINGPVVSTVAPSVVTDRDGRFTFRGIGRERIARLHVEGPGIQTERLYTRTRAGKTIELLSEWRTPHFGTYTYYPSEFTYVAGPSKPIVGTVRDRKTNQPLAGVEIRSQKRHGHPITGWGEDFVRTLTDQQGRYRLEGMPIGKENEIAAVPPIDQPYLAVSKSSNTGGAGEQVEIDFELTRGVWIEGRVTDKASGKGLVGNVEHFIFADDPHLKALGRFDNVDLRERHQSDANGHFRIPALPGRGIVGVLVHDNDRMYARGAGAEKIKGGKTDIGALRFDTEPSYCVPINLHALVEVNPSDDAQRVEVNFTLDSGRKISGRVVDPDGRPLHDYMYTGRVSDFATWEQPAADRFEVIAYDPSKPRRLMFFHRERRLAGTLLLSGEPATEPIVKLQLAGKVTGRLVDRDGEPLAEMMLTEWRRRSTSPDRMQASNGDQRREVALPPNLSNWRSARHATGKDGQFEIDGLAHGVEYWLKAYDRETTPPGGGRMLREGGVLNKSITVEPGQSLDLGDVQITNENKLSASEPNAKPDNLEQQAPPKTSDARSKPDKSADSQSSQHNIQIHGRITGPDGKPVAGAHVAAIGMDRQVGRGGDLKSQERVFGETTTSADGTYELQLTGVTSRTHSHASLVARTDGTGVAWQRLDLDRADVEASFKLAHEQLIHGRFVDIEGKPAANVRMTIASVKPASTEWFFESGVGFYRDDAHPAAWPPSITSDDNGRFVIHGIAAGHGVYINIPAMKGFAPQSIELNTGMPEQRTKQDGTYRAQVTKNLKPGEEAVLPLAPEQVFEGNVTFEDSGKPAPHARLTIWASQQKFGSMHSVAGTADGEGRYRISPTPGIRFGVTAYPPDATPYMARQMRDVDWEDSATRKKVDVKLPRGILVRGQVIDSGSGLPVAGASIQYVPEEANNRNATDDILTGWQGIQPSDEAGKFAITILPGPGRLLVHGPPGEFVVKESTTRELNSGRTGGTRCYANAFHRLDPSKDAGPIDLEIKLERAQKVIGKLVDEQGHPIQKAIVISRLVTHPHLIEWRGDLSFEASGGQFELPGLAPNQDTDVYFLDAERKLGASATIKADGSSPTITLKPCGQAVARFTDSDGEPLANISAALHMVVTPGAQRDDPIGSLAMKAGMPGAETDSVSNIDRKNYRPGPRTDKNGRITFPALIQGATYQLLSDNNPKEFKVGVNQTVDLGNIVIDRRR